MANEPVYNQHATAYLLRDDVKPAIRAFYSMLACAFSHSVLEPVEHRWGWGQYFGPPSTDGAWFDLYRHMLIQEQDDDTLAPAASHAAKVAGGWQADRNSAGADVLWTAEHDRREPRGERHDPGQPGHAAALPAQGTARSAAPSCGQTHGRGQGQRPEAGRISIRRRNGCESPTRTNRITRS